MGKKKNIPKSLENQSGEITYSCYDNKAIIDFCDNDKQTPAELTEFKFVVDSYFESCFVLLTEVEKYATSDSFNDKKRCLLKYLPAVFCFRHYIELKIKYLYMHHTGKSFNTNEHSLSVLLKELQEASGLDYAIFNSSISYISEIEKIDNNERFDAFSRYLVDRNFNFSKKLSIVLDDIKRMKRSLVEIEGRIEERDQLEWFLNLLKQSEEVE